MKNTVTTALVLGATGATGREIVNLLTDNKHFNKVYLLVRRLPGGVFGSNVEPVVSNPLAASSPNRETESMMIIGGGAYFGISYPKA